MCITNKTLRLIKQNTVYKNNVYNKQNMQLIKQNTANNETKHCVKQTQPCE